MRAPWPIEVQALGAAVAGTVLWRHAGRSTLTVVVKASFTIEEGMAKLTAPADLVIEERAQPQSRSLLCDSDIAPYKPRAEITFVGSACPPSATQQIVTRLAVSGSSPLFDRSLVVSGDRAAPGAPPSAFRTMPIVWDRTWADPMLNPVGVQRGSGRAANVVDPSDESAPACYGPISRSWGARARFLGRGDPRRTEGTRPEMPAELSWGLFLSAPAEQQISRLQGDEAFLLENLIEGRPRVYTQLPSPRAVARYHGPKAPRDGAPIAMRLDTIALNGYDGSMQLIWRGTMAFPDENVAAQSRVSAGLEMPAQQIPFAAAAQKAEAAPSPPTVRMTTKGLGPILPVVPPQSPPARPSETERPFPKDSGTMPVGRQIFTVPKVADDASLYDIDDPESSAGSTMAIDPEAAMKMLAGAKATPWDANRAPPPAPPPPAPPPPAPAPAARASVPKTAPAPAGPPYPVASPGFPPPVVVRPAGAEDIDDDDSVGSTMAITPEAAAELIARRPQQGAPQPAGPPPAPPPPTPAGLVSPQRTPARTRPPTVPLPAPPPPMPPAPVAPPAFRPPAVTPDGRHGTLEMEPVPDSEAGGGTMVLQVPEDIAKRR